MQFPEITNYYILLGENIKRAREIAKLTQLDLANALGLSRVSIVNIEKGRQRPMPHHLNMISTFLQCSIDEIFPQLRFENDNILKQISNYNSNPESTEILKAFITKHTTITA